jgi:hypothetical protein
MVIVPGQGFLGVGQFPSQRRSGCDPVDVGVGDANDAHLRDPTSRLHLEPLLIGRDRADMHPV